MLLKTERPRTYSELDDTTKQRIESLHTLIFTETETPNVIGLFGRWGSGKSTLLNGLNDYHSELKTNNPERLQELQAKEERIDDHVFINFDAWQYEQAENLDLVFALIEKIHTVLKFDGTKWKKIKSALITSADVVTDLATILFTPIGILKTFFVVFLQTIGRYKDAYSARVDAQLNAYEKWVNETSDLKTLFAEEIARALNGRKLILAIDNLDRCTPSNSIKMLEAIKTFLDARGVVFVLALDHIVIEQMIEKTYGLRNGYGAEYLMKIVHYCYFLPNIDPEQDVSGIFSSFEIDLESSPHFKKFVMELVRRYFPEPRKYKYHLMNFLVHIAHSDTLRADYDSSLENKQLLFLAFCLKIKFPYLFSDANIDPKIIKNLRSYFESHDNAHEGSRASANAKLSNLPQIPSDDMQSLEKLINIGIYETNETRLPSNHIRLTHTLCKINGSL